MANKILQFTTPEKTSTSSKSATYLDINMVASPVTYVPSTNWEGTSEKYKKDIDWLYKQKAQYKVDKLVDVEAVKNSIHNIFSWIPGERIINPEFGTQLYRYLYEGITDFNVEVIMAEIRHCVSQWEPRVQIEKVMNVGNVSDTEHNTVRLDVLYSIIGLADQLFTESITYSKDT